MIQRPGSTRICTTLIDQYRSLGKYNNGYAYNMMFVGPGWMNKMGRWEQPYELLYKSYSDGCAYYGKPEKERQVSRYDNVRSSQITTGERRAWMPATTMSRVRTLERISFTDQTSSCSGTVIRT